MIPRPLVHADLATAAALAAPHEQRPAAPVKIGLAEREGFVDAKSGAPQHDDQSPQTTYVRLSPVWRITATISSLFGESPA